ncbi:MAG: hypothetical protein M3R08_09530 [Bacteroidota bacterium]|nr:hypothetical protein [Bacteroidota bacterium]
MTAAHDPRVIQGKVIPEAILCETEIALSYYPELKDARIVFRFKKEIRNSLMQAQPRGFFMGGNGRYYVINISERFFIDEQTKAIKGVPSEALIGWLVHELGHVMDYHGRSSMGLVIFGFKYVTSGKYLRQAEKTADTFAVENGCGNYLVDCKEFILGHDELPERYKQKIRRSYLSPASINEMVVAREAEVKQK